MRSILPGLLLAAVFPLSSPVAAHPKAQVGVSQHDYGQRLPGLLPPIEFTITNTGDAPLELKPRPCCDIIVTGAETPVAPGTTRRLVVRAAHLHDGLFRKTVRVLTNDPSAPELQFQLTAVGKSPIDLYPSDELSVPLNTGGTVAQRVTLRCNDEPELKITSIRSSNPSVLCQEVPPMPGSGDEPKRCRAVEIGVTPDGAAAPFEAVVVIGTNCKRAPEVKLRVYGISANAVMVQPPRIDFDPIDPKEPYATRLLMITRAAGPFKILKTITSDPRMEVKVNLDPSGTYGEILAMFTPGHERGPFHGMITLQTDDPERPRLVIPYTGEAR
jgi:hypothetical protein